MNDKEFMTFLDTVTPNNLNIYKYLMVTRNKLRQHQRIALPTLYIGVLGLMLTLILSGTTAFLMLKWLKTFASLLMI